MIYFVIFSKATQMISRFGSCAPELLTIETKLVDDEDMLIMTNPDGTALTEYVEDSRSYINFNTREYFQIGNPPSIHHHYNHLLKIWEERMDIVIPDYPVPIIPKGWTGDTPM